MIKLLKNFWTKSPNARKDIEIQIITFYINIFSKLKILIFTSSFFLIFFKCRWRFKDNSYLRRYNLNKNQLIKYFKILVKECFRSFRHCIGTRYLMMHELKLCWIKFASLENIRNNFNNASVNILLVCGAFVSIQIKERLIASCSSFSSTW